MWRVVYFYTSVVEQNRFWTFIVCKIPYCTPWNVISSTSEHWWGAFEEVLGKITGYIQLCCKGEKNNIIMSDKDVWEHS